MKGLKKLKAVSFIYLIKGR